MIHESQFPNILFLDVETVPQYESYLDLPDPVRALWNHKAKFIGEDTPLRAYKKAGIYAEFGKIVCISVGYLTMNKTTVKNFRLKSFYGENEFTILNEFKKMLKDFQKKSPVVLCAHNGKEFDYPYLSRRMIINRIALPESLRLHGRKPWEVPHLDTMELWRFGDYKQFTSLKLLCEILDIPTPKDDMDGSMVGDFYYGKRLEDIVTYCQKDVVATTNVLLRFSNKPILNENQVVIVN